MEERLARCPFCGKEPELVRVSKWRIDQFGDYHKCWFGRIEHTCSVSINTNFYYFENDAIKAWNTRRPQERELLSEEALFKYLLDCGDSIESCGDYDLKKISEVTVAKFGAKPMVLPARKEHTKRCQEEPEICTWDCGATWWNAYDDEVKRLNKQAKALPSKSKNRGYCEHCGQDEKWFDNPCTSNKGHKLVYESSQSNPPTTE